MPLPTAEPGVFRRDFRLLYPDADPAGLVRATSLLNLLQVQAGDHTDSRGFDYRTHKDQGVFWVLSRLTVEVDRWPAWPCTLTVDTWSRTTKAVFALRDFRFGPTEGSAWMGRASSAWVLLKDRKPQRPEPWVAIYDRVSPEPPVADLPASLPLLAPETPAAGEVEADWEDVDMNGHVNNVRSVAWCLARHDQGFLSAWRPGRIEANFLAEMFEGERFRILRTEAPADEGAAPGAERVFDYQVVKAADRTPTLRVRVRFRPAGPSSPGSPS